MKKVLTLLLMLGLSFAAFAQMVDPVKFSSKLEMLKDGEAQIVFTGKIDDGWHVYSTNLGNDGPISATFNAVKMDGAEPVGKLTPKGHEISQFDNMFGMKLRFFEKSVTFVQKIKFTKPEYSINCYLEYGACNDETCMPPTEVPFTGKGKSPAVAASAEKPKVADAAAPATEEKAEEVVAETTADTMAVAAIENDSVAAVASSDSDLYRPVINELKAYEDNPVDSSLFYIFLAGFAGGFLALLTPCVWPIIPMTVSFFLKRNKERSKAIREAVTYGISIVVIYVVLGLVVTLLFGASALNALSTNAIFNIFFCLLLVVFAASFFGAFEITLPSSWSNKIDEKSENTSGLLSIFLMAFTLTLVSFSCTGPIIGFLLVAVSTQGSILSPTIGMLGFAIALAIPFTLFAMFPSLLKSAPKSGGWMNVVKVVLGFIELAFALKFLSVADLAYGWHILDREVFLCLWIVIFGLLGIYLFGWLKFPHDDPDHRTNVPQFFIGMISLAFAIYMIPGLWGAPLKAISAFAPPMNTQDFNLHKSAVEPKSHDYEEGMAMAKAKGLPVMIDFTGFGCVNCRKMEAAVWTDPQVASVLNEKYVLISLYVDDKTPLAEPVVVNENGQQRTLRTVGDKWSYLQRVKFGANTQPFYVLIDNDGNPLNGSRSYDEDIQKYLDFLQKGLDNYKK
ncbi:MAG: thioredoxin family protein [Prevotella sp.]|nr:thioredoxin family protein [Prevotella sp.]MCI7089829.1 thioredoxin family protein [Prevotella sp.]MCI7257116.1 thioredoxin family protein [Prevotella sp.]MDD5785215.1 cytochrome c biogenesis protein CcdA [Prevotella sp.]MDD7225266.1 cytochrome c biogenesis protein CcdA [Prevotella sp.]